MGRTLRRRQPLLTRTQRKEIKMRWLIERLKETGTQNAAATAAIIAAQMQPEYSNLWLAIAGLITGGVAVTKEPNNA